MIDLLLQASKHSTLAEDTSGSFQPNITAFDNVPSNQKLYEGYQKYKCTFGCTVCTMVTFLND